MKKDSIGNRMKENYEQRYRIKLIRRTPVIMRLDGKAFHTLTRKCKKPYDVDFQSVMQDTALKLCEEIQGAKCAYVQSDEISVLLTDFDRLKTDAWFDYNLQKIVSISAGIASAFFTTKWSDSLPAIFDCRAFNIPKEEVCNYFIWRQKDWFRNSIQMLAQAYYSPKQLHKKNTNDMREMLRQKGIDWEKIDPIWKNGTFIFYTDCWNSTHDIIFTQNRECVEKLMEVVEE